ncbi:transposase [Hyalangium versicolor]|uniref:transposase n=1 Tax=Hyalangium versicolor TaxID=2861190 RepID=UPI001CCA53EA|nr:transposase [Hyalangium versicolor]
MKKIICVVRSCRLLRPMTLEEAKALCLVLTEAMILEQERTRKATKHLVPMPRSPQRILLSWDANGFCVVSKRLEARRFRVPPVVEGQASVSLEAKQLVELLSLVEAARTRRRAVH